MTRLSTAALIAGAFIANLTHGAQAQTVSSTNGSYTVTFTETTTGGGAAPYLYSYNATINAPSNGSFVDGFIFTFAAPNLYSTGSVNPGSFIVADASPTSIFFSADTTRGGTPLSASNPTTTFSFQSAFAPSATPQTLGITPSGGSSAGPGPGVGNLFVGPVAAPEPGTWAAFALGTAGLLGLTARARRRADPV